MFVCWQKVFNSSQERKAGWQPTWIYFWRIISVECHGIVSYKKNALVNSPLHSKRTHSKIPLNEIHRNVMKMGIPNDRQTLQANNPTFCKSWQCAFTKISVTPHSLAIYSTPSDLITIPCGKMHVLAFFWFLTSLKFVLA